MQDWARATAGVSATSANGGNTARKARRRERNRKLLWPRPPGIRKRITDALQRLGFGCHLGPVRIGIDVGGTKIEGLLLGDGGREVARQRIATPTEYRPLLAAIAELVRGLAAQASELSGAPPSRWRRNARVPAARPRRDLELEPALPQRSPARQGPRAGARATRCGWPTTPSASSSPRRSTAPRRHRPSSTGRAPTSSSARRWGRASGAASSSTDGC